jgi:acyl-CoA synthetase
VTGEFDRPRPLPESIVARWEADEHWSGSTVSEVIDDAPFGDKTACVVGAARYTFGDLHDWSAQVAQVLQASGVQRGERVLIQLPNCVELIVSILASWWLGAVAVPVLPLLREHELRAVARQTRPSAVIATHRSGKHIPTKEIDAALAAISVAPVVRLSTRSLADGWAGFPDASRVDSENDWLGPGLTNAAACAAILFTSGTTAEPKGVRHDSRSLLAEVHSYRRSAALTAHDVIFNPAPIAHVGALIISVLVPWCIGTPIVLLPSWDAEQARQVVERERVTFAVGAPPFLNELVTQYESTKVRGHRLTKFQTGAAPTSPELLARADRVGIAAWRAWGMTEAPTVSYGVPDDPLERRANWDGRIEPGSEVVAVDESGRVLAHGCEGQLLLRSPKQMLGYIEPVAGAVSSDGWLASGDVGIVDADGWVRITGRIKDIINRGGEKFSAREIESALCSHPAVEAAAVLGVPERRLGEQVVAYVTVRNGCRYPGFSALVEHLKSMRMAPQKHPVAITVVDALPMTATGKIQKSALAELWQASRTVGDEAGRSAPASVRVSPI